MTTPWLHIIGIGEDGMDGLSAAARALVEGAEIIIGGERHHKMASAPDAIRLAWPSPFDAMIGSIESHRGKREAVLVTVLHLEQSRPGPPALLLAKLVRQ